MKLKIYNSKSKSKENFNPINKNKCPEKENESQ